MRQERKVLKHHADFLVAKLPQRLALEGHDIGAFDQNGAGSGFEQAIEMANQGGLAAAGEAHDAEDLTAPDLQHRFS